MPIPPPVKFSIGLLLALLSLGQVMPAQDLPPGDLPKPPPIPSEILEKGPVTPPPDLPDPSQLMEQLKQLEDLLSLPPEKLQKLRQTIEFIERMNPEEREAMRIRLTQITQMTDAVRAEVDRLAVLLPDSMKSDLSQYWLAATEKERAQVRAFLKPLSESAQSAFLNDKVTAFIEHRDAVFEKMKATLEARKDKLQNPGK